MREKPATKFEAAFGFVGESDGDVEPAAGAAGAAEALLPAFVALSFGVSIMLDTGTAVVRDAPWMVEASAFTTFDVCATSVRPDTIHG